MSGAAAAAPRPGGGRRCVASGLLALALLLGLSCHGSAQTSSAPAGEARPDPAAVVARPRVFLIAPHDGGRNGRKVACDDSAVAVDATLPEPAPALPGALRALLAMSDHYDRGSGLLNQLYASRLDLLGIDRQGGRLTVRLRGYVESGDACDNQRILAELSETALQFDGITDVRFEVEGQPLQTLLAGNAVPAEPAPAFVPAPPATSPPPAASDPLRPRPTGEAAPFSSPDTPRTAEPSETVPPAAAGGSAMAGIPGRSAGRSFIAGIPGRSAGGSIIACIPGRSR
jgi:hypothetical protein